MKLPASRASCASRMKRRPESYRSCCHNHPFRRAQIALSKTHPLTAPMGYVEHGRVRLLSPSRLQFQFQFTTEEVM